MMSIPTIFILFERRRKGEERGGGGVEMDSLSWLTCPKENCKTGDMFLDDKRKKKKGYEWVVSSFGDE